MIFFWKDSQEPAVPAQPDFFVSIVLALPGNLPDSSPSVHKAEL
jgi:hypothetical protein